MAYAIKNNNYRELPVSFTIITVLYHRISSISRIQTSEEVNSANIALSEILSGHGTPAGSKKMIFLRDVSRKAVLLMDKCQEGAIAPNAKDITPLPR